MANIRTLPRIMADYIMLIVWKLIFPFAIIKVRIIQYRYRRITERNIECGQSNMVINTLSFLLAKEYYMERRFDAWGVYHPSCVMRLRYKRFLMWLFPMKTYKQVKTVVWHDPRAVVFYQNKIYRLQNGKSPIYEVEISKQLNAWWRSNYKYCKKK